MNTGVLSLTLLLQLNPGSPDAPAVPPAPAEAAQEAEAPPEESSSEPREPEGQVGEEPPDSEVAPEQPGDPIAPESAETSLDVSAAAVEPGPPRDESPPPDASVEAEEPDPLSVDPATIRFKAGKGLLFESRDGTFGMAIRSRIQLRHEYFHNTEESEDGELDSGHLLMVRRARLNVLGHFFGEHNKYKLQLALSPRDMQFGPNGAQRSPVLDAIMEFDHLRDFTLSVGQFMVPWNRQRIVSSGDFELIDRSIASGEFHLDRDIGFQLSSNDLGGFGRFRYLLGVFNGEGRDANEFSDDGLLYVGRIEALPLGDSKSRWDYEEGHLDRDTGPRFSIGAAYAYHDRAARDRGVMGEVPSDGGTTDLHLMTADVVAQWAGVSLMAEVYRRDGTRSYGEATVEDAAGNPVPAPLADVREGTGYFVQAGYVLLWIPIGFAARYSCIVADETGSSLSDARELGAGPSWYIGAHDFKLQADYFRLFEEKIGEGTDFVRTQLTVGF